MFFKNNVSNSLETRNFQVGKLPQGISQRRL